jgi:hypothetical protein
MNRYTVMDLIHRQLSNPSEGGDNRVVVDPEWIGVLTTMAPGSEVVRRGDRWVQCRTERLDEGRTLAAVISRDATGDLHVTAHTDPQAMGAEWHRLGKDILGRPRGARIRQMNALDLVGRTVLNEHGAAFAVGGLYLDAFTGAIVIDLLEVDQDGEPIPGTESGICTLDGWTVL